MSLILRPFPFADKYHAPTILFALNFPWSYNSRNKPIHGDVKRYLKVHVMYMVAIKDLIKNWYKWLNYSPCLLLKLSSKHGITTVRHLCRIHWKKNINNIVLINSVIIFLTPSNTIFVKIDSGNTTSCKLDTSIISVIHIGNLSQYHIPEPCQLSLPASSLW